MAIAAQLIVIFVGFGEAAVLRRFIFPLSYLLLFAFVLFNWRHPGIVIIGVGALLNFSAIVANGGLMPVSPHTIERAGLEDEIAGRELGDPLPTSKNVLLDEDDTYLQPLSDRLVWEALGPLKVFSVGDVVIVAGLALVLLELLLPVVRRGSANGAAAR